MNLTLKPTIKAISFYIVFILLFTNCSNPEFEMIVVNNLEESVDIEENGSYLETVGANNNLSLGFFDENTLYHFTAFGQVSRNIVGEIFVTVTERDEYIWVIHE